MSENQAVLFANEAFYVAFASGDHDAMEDVWAKSTTVTCIHPGWRHLQGRNVVMESWHSILDHPDSRNMKFRDATVTVHGDTALVICYEILPPNAAVATNVFVKENGAWHIVHHQASVTAPLEPGENAQPTETHH